jgi:CheY-like chemotaxis protein
VINKERAMYRIVFVSSKPASLQVLAQALEVYTGGAVEWAVSGEEVLALVKHAAPDLIILDEKSDEPMDFSLVRKILQLNALINIVMISQATEKEFHDAAEGLGVLMQLPPRPELPEAEVLVARLVRLGVDFQGERSNEETTRQRGHSESEGGAAS